jgi:hypothetical protein
MHTFGGHSIKDKCQFCVNLHIATLFMHLFLWVFPVYVACVFPLLFYIKESVLIVFVCL